MIARKRSLKYHWEAEWRKRRSKTFAKINLDQAGGEWTRYWTFESLFEKGYIDLDENLTEKYEDQ